MVAAFNAEQLRASQMGTYSAAGATARGSTRSGVAIVFVNVRAATSGTITIRINYSPGIGWNMETEPLTSFTPDGQKAGSTRDWN